MQRIKARVSSGVVVLGLAGVPLLVACEKPTPAVTVQSLGTSVRSEALSYQREGKTVEDRKTPEVLEVRPGEAVTIDVDRTTAEAGWVAVLGDTQITPILEDDHHHVFEFPRLQQEQVTLAIFEAPEVGTATARGTWIFTLRQKP